MIALRVTPVPGVHLSTAQRPFSIHLYGNNAPR